MVLRMKHPCRSEHNHDHNLSSFSYFRSAEKSARRRPQYLTGGTTSHSAGVAEERRRMDLSTSSRRTRRQANIRRRWSLIHSVTAAAVAAGTVFMTSEVFNLPGADASSHHKHSCPRGQVPVSVNGLGPQFCVPFPACSTSYRGNCPGPQEGKNLLPRGSTCVRLENGSGGVCVPNAIDERGLDESEDFDYYYFDGNLIKLPHQDYMSPAAVVGDNSYKGGVAASPSAHQSLSTEGRHDDDDRDKEFAWQFDNADIAAFFPASNLATSLVSDKTGWPSTAGVAGSDQPQGVYIYGDEDKPATQSSPLQQERKQGGAAISSPFEDRWTVPSARLSNGPSNVGVAAASSSSAQQDGETIQQQLYTSPGTITTTIPGSPRTTSSGASSSTSKSASVLPHPRLYPAGTSFKYYGQQGQIETTTSSQEEQATMTDRLDPATSSRFSATSPSSSSVGTHGKQVVPEDITTSSVSSASPSSEGNHEAFAGFDRRLMVVSARDTGLSVEGGDPSDGDDESVHHVEGDGDLSGRAMLSSLSVADRMKLLYSNDDDDKATSSTAPSKAPSSPNPSLSKRFRTQTNEHVESASALLPGGPSSAPPSSRPLLEDILIVQRSEIAEEEERDVAMLPAVLSTSSTREGIEGLEEAITTLSSSSSATPSSLSSLPQQHQIAHQQEHVLANSPPSISRNSARRKLRHRREYSSSFIPY